ncbi:TetR family transcriptional regulator [Nocardia carnea]|uniref:TetR family transcriptional regulator n=1 Tax=Nocardia carnea TaxID=37328 RepID=UPI0024564325|nr:TetR family transcriptional regulator [Nocardia carnea]
MSEGLRERTRRAVRAELTEVAIALFARQGFEATTVDEIARAAGMTKRSFFRYFPSKEEAVFGGIDTTGEKVVAELAARPAGEDPWDSLQHVLRNWQEEIHAGEQVLAVLRLVEATPALAGRLHQRRAEWRQRVSDAVRQRPGAGIDSFTADLLTNTAVAVLDTVSSAWLRSDGTADRSALLDRGFALARVRGNAE